MPDRTSALPRSVRIVHLPGARNATGEQPYPNDNGER